MSETTKRILVACGIVGAIFIAWLFHHWGLHGFFLLSFLVFGGMVFEFLRCLWKAPRDVMFNTKNLIAFALFLVLLVVDLIAALQVSVRPSLLLMIFLVVCAADIGAWLFGHIIGGDKLWEKISEHKTWSGQIFGIICGTLIAIAYGYFTRGKFMPALVWIGISFSLLSQYGDLTASFIKRKLGIKDFSNVLSVHGGILDRFDGWIYILPLVWMIIA